MYLTFYSKYVGHSDPLCYLLFMEQPASCFNSGPINKRGMAQGYKNKAAFVSSKTIEVSLSDW